MAERAALGLFLLLILWAPFPLGSNRIWAWTLLELGLFASVALWTVAWLQRRHGSLALLRAARPAFALLAAWLAFLAFQWLPLPATLVRRLSPHAAEIQELAAPYRDSAWMTLSIQPGATFAFWLKSCAWVAAFFLALALAHSRERARLLAYSLVVSGVLQAVYAVLMHLAGGDVTIYGTKILHGSYATGGFVNRNHLAGFLEMTLALGIGLMVGSLRETGTRNWRQFWRDTVALLLSAKAVLRLMLVMMVVALVLTRSRGGNTAFFASLLVAGAIALAFSRYATRNTVVLIASLIAIDVLIVGSWFGVERTMQRIEQTTAQDVGARQDPSRHALEMARDYPVFGAGAGTFHTAFTRYRGPDIGAFYDHLENDYAQFLVETGAIGVALAGSFAAMALALSLLALARRRDPFARGLAFGVLMGVVAIGIHSAVDFNLQIPANAFLFMILLAFAWIAYYIDRGVQ